MNKENCENMEKFSFEELLDGEFAKDDIKEGSIVKAKVLSLSKDFVLVDIGYKSEGLISVREFYDMDGNLNINKDDIVEVFIESIEDDDGHIVLSKDKADKLKIWEEIERAANNNDTIDGLIVSRVKGGLHVDIGVRAFLPGSQVDLRPIKDLDKLIGERFKFKVIKFNKKRSNIVLSRRIMLEKERQEKRQITLDMLKEGIIMHGTVKNITDYGVFIDLGGVDGLLHVTDISWGRIQHPNEIFSIGDVIKVKVLKYELETERVSLGVKQIEEDPWLKAQNTFPVGNKVSGKVVSLTDYGAFIELIPGVEGLIHVSEMSWTKRIKHPSKIVNIGDEINAVVLDIDQDNKRISLGMKQTIPNPWSLLQEKYPVGTVIRGKARSITDFGIFIGIEDDIDGLVHVSDISWTHRIKHPSEIYKKDDAVEAVVLNIDMDNERFSLGIKQLNEDPWIKIPKIYYKGMKVVGVINKITNFGVYIEIESGLDGFCHNSECYNKNDDHYVELHEGNQIEVFIMDINQKERKINLSMKTANKNKSDKNYQDYLKSSKKSHVTDSVAFGTFGDAFKDKFYNNEKDKILKNKKK